MLVLDFGPTHFGGLIIGKKIMNKEEIDEKDFMMAFFDCILVVPQKDLADKQDNLKYSDFFHIFKVGQNNEKRII